MQYKKKILGTSLEKAILNILLNFSNGTLYKQRRSKWRQKLLRNLRDDS